MPASTIALQKQRRDGARPVEAEQKDDVRGEPMPPVAVASDFCFESAVAQGAVVEINQGHLDIGPIDTLTDDELFAAFDAYFGSGPLTPVPSSPSLPPSPLPSPAPALATAHTPTAASSSSTSVPPTSSHPGPQDAGVAAESRQPSGNSKTRKRKIKSRDRRREKRREENAKKPRYGERPSVMLGHVSAAPSTAVSFDVAKGEVASTGFSAVPDDGGGVYSVDHLVNKLGFTYVEANGLRPRAFTDSANRVIAVYAGAPNDPGWEQVCEQAYDALQAGASRCEFTTKMKKHRRGNFPALNAGVSHGNGRLEPGNLSQNSKIHASVVDDLLRHPSFIRIAGFASSAFATWAPKLYAFYEDTMAALFNWKPTLRRLFANSVFAACAFNFGPRTVSKRHRDFANIPFGFCAVTALGRFDHKKGGHMVLWQLRLVVEFPASSTMLLTSAIVGHCNTPIQKGEVRCSFAQYTAGGLVRWVAHGFKSDAEYFEGMGDDQLENVRIENEARCRYGATLFSTLEELQADVD